MLFTFTLKHEDGSPAEPPTFSTAVPNWSPGDTIPLGSDRTLRDQEVDAAVQRVLNVLGKSLDVTVRTS